VRLGIPCKTTRPRFKFVGDTVDPVTARVGASRRASPRSESENYRHTRGNDGKNGSHKPSQPSLLAAEERDDGDDLEMALANDDSAFNADGPPMAQSPSQSRSQSCSKYLQYLKFMDTILHGRSAKNV
jgi:hypothetical protein